MAYTSSVIGTSTLIYTLATCTTRNDHHLPNALVTWISNANGYWASNLCDSFRAMIRHSTYYNVQYIVAKHVYITSNRLGFKNN